MVVDTEAGRLYHSLRLLGALAQLGERNTGSVEVSGSIPLGSTKFNSSIESKNHCKVVFLCPTLVSLFVWNKLYFFLLILFITL